METLNCQSDPLKNFLLPNALKLPRILQNIVQQPTKRSTATSSQEKDRFLCLNCLDVFCILRLERMGTIGEGASGIFMFLYFLILGFKFSDHIQAFMFDCNKPPSALFLDISVSRQAC